MSGSRGGGLCPHWLLLLDVPVDVGHEGGGAVGEAYR